MERWEIVEILSTLPEDVGLHEPGVWDKDCQEWRVKAIEAIREAKSIIKATKPVGSFRVGGFTYYIFAEPPAPDVVQDVQIGEDERSTEDGE